MHFMYCKVIIVHVHEDSCKSMDPLDWQLSIDSCCSSHLCLFPQDFQIITGFIQVLENPGILLWHFPGLESPGKRPLVLESFRNLLNSTKNYEVY